jgi:hypothetical protein
MLSKLWGANKAPSILNVALDDVSLLHGAATFHFCVFLAVRL